MGIGWPGKLALDLLLCRSKGLIPFEGAECETCIEYSSNAGTDACRSFTNVTQSTAALSISLVDARSFEFESSFVSRGKLNDPPDRLNSVCCGCCFGPIGRVDCQCPAAGL